jgi:hypothetical protein
MQTAFITTAETLSKKMDAPPAAPRLSFSHLIKGDRQRGERRTLPMLTILLVILILALLGVLPAWPYSHAWGYYPTGGLGILLIIVIILMLL